MLKKKFLTVLYIQIFWIVAMLAHSFMYFVMKSIEIACQQWKLFLHVEYSRHKKAHSNWNKNRKCSIFCMLVLLRYNIDYQMHLQQHSDRYVDGDAVFSSFSYIILYHATTSSISNITYFMYILSIKITKYLNKKKGKFIENRTISTCTHRKRGWKKKKFLT